MVCRFDTVCDAGDCLDENNNKKAINEYENTLKRRRSKTMIDMIGRGKNGTYDTLGKAYKVDNL